MAFVQNFPFICILLTLFSGPLCAVLKGRAAKWVNTVVIVLTLAMSAAVLIFSLSYGDSYVYQMGHFSAPWGNELRVGVLEALMAVFFCVIMLLCELGGRWELEDEIEKSKQNLYYVMIGLLLSSLLALIYTNDIFTSYVFIEISTISACGLIMIRQTGHTMEASMRYMIMNLLGSGLFLLGICFLYDLTGHLLMSNIQEQVAVLVSSDTYRFSLLVTLTLITLGLAIKSAMWPFHAWLPDAYGYSTVSSSAILSSLVSKGYIFLLIKIFYRVFGFEVIRESRVITVLFICGILGMIMGSISAIREDNVRRMLAFSSVAQIGYIFMGLGLGTTAGIVASLFHILSHAATKAILFISVAALTDVSNDKTDFFSLTGAGYRNRLGGIAFTVGSLSMIGFPLCSGFISKILFAQAAYETSYALIPALIAMAVSTILNAVYFMKTVIRLYTPAHRAGIEVDNKTMKMTQQPVKAAAMIALIALNLFLGIFSEPIVNMISEGLAMFA